MTAFLKRFFKNKEAKNASWIIGGRVVQMLLSLAVGVLSARYLGPGNYGLINYGNAYVAFFTSFCTLGINSVIIKDFVDHPDEEGNALGSTLCLQFVSSLLSMVAIMSIVSFVDNDDPMAIAVVFLCCIGSVFHVFDSLRFWFQSRYQSKITSLAALFAYVITSAYKIILLILGKSVYWFAFASSVDYICAAVFLFIVYNKKGGPRLSFSFRKSAGLLKNSYPYILAGAMVAVYAQTDKIMLKMYMDAAEVGFYSTATVLCNIWTFVLSAIIESLYPSILSLHKTDRVGFERKNRQLYAIIFYVSTFVSVMFFLFGELAIRIIYGEAYLPAATPLKIITWYTAFSFLGSARNAWILSEGKQKYLTPIYAAAAIINVGLNILLIPIGGAFGAALASLSAQVLTSIILPLFLKDLRPNAKLMLEAIILKDVFPKRIKKSNDNQDSEV